MIRLKFYEGLVTRRVLWYCQHFSLIGLFIFGLGISTIILHTVSCFDDIKDWSTIKRVQGSL